MGVRRDVVVAVVVALIAVAGCKKQKKREAVGPAPAGAPADADALWALAPPETYLGIVASARGLQHVDGAARTLDKLLADKPELGPIDRPLRRELRRLLGTTTASLEALGLTDQQGAALFVTDAGPVAVLPLVDRARFLERTRGEPGGAVDRVNGWACRIVEEVYACSPVERLLAGLGAGKPPPGLDRVGARGDIELAGAVPSLPWGPMAIVVQTRRGAVTVRAAVTGLPARVSATLANAAPRVEPTSGAFAVFNMVPLLRSVPPGPLAPGVNLHELADALDGPLTITVSAGPDPVAEVRQALRQPALVLGLVERCDSIELLRPAGARVEGGVCKIPMAQLGIEAEAWVDGETLYVGRRGVRPDGTPASLTELGREIAGGEWLLATYGRGTALGAQEKWLAGPGQMPGDLQTVTRIAALLSEVALAARIDGDTLHVVMGLRTVWDNPDDVVAELLDVEPEASLDGSANATLAAAAARAPDAPFAGDHVVGAGGLTLPVGVFGLVASVVIPAFVASVKAPPTRTSWDD